jgi:ATP-dependent Zn protease
MAATTISRLTDEEAAFLRVHVAVHEAGHAIVGLGLGLNVTEISLEGGDPNGARFFVSFDRPAQTLLAEQPELMGPTLIAGTSAEIAILRAHLTEGYAGDMQAFMNVFGRLTQEESQAMLQPHVTRARQLVRAHRDAIETVASQLLVSSRLTGDEVRALRERAKTAPIFLPSWAYPVEDDRSG